MARENSEQRGLMELTEGILRATKDPKDEAFAEAIGSLRKARGKDLPLPKSARVFSAQSEASERFSTWGSVKLGTKTLKHYEETFEQNGIHVSSYVQDIIRLPGFSTLKDLKQEPQTIDPLFRVKAGDLVPGNEYSWKQIKDGARDNGLESVPAEAALQLRLNDKDQPRGDWYTMGMEPIADSNGDPAVFALAHAEDGLWLRGYWPDPGYEWGSEDEFVFRSSK